MATSIGTSTLTTQEYVIVSAVNGTNTVTFQEIGDQSNETYAIRGLLIDEICLQTIQEGACNITIS